MDFIDATAIAIQARVPVLLEGAPGDAKTAIIDGLLSRLTYDHEIMVLAFREPADVGGYPVDTPEGMALKPTRWAQRLADGANKREEKGAWGAGLFLDELTSAPPAVRAAALRGIAEGVWGEIAIPNLAVVAAQNPPELAEAGFQLSAAMANRFVHLAWAMPIPEWSLAMLTGFKVPEVPIVPADWEKRLPMWRSRIAAFAQRVPDSIRSVPKDPQQQSKAWPSLRTWTYASRLLAACEAAGMTLLSTNKFQVPHLLLSGAVGQGAATEFVKWIRDLDLPDPESLIQEPSRPLPKRQDQIFALLSSVAAAILANNTEDRWQAGWKVLANAVESGYPDVAAIAAQMLAVNPPFQGARAGEAIATFVPMLKAAGIIA